MIYVIQVRYEDVTLLKIGYTGDLKKETRYASYRLHNPKIEILYEIPEGDEEDEKYLHYYFNEFKFKDYGNEWFIKDSMILDYFETHKTKESLQDLRDKGLVVDLKSFGVFRNKVKSIINRVINLRVSSGDITLEQGLRQIDSMTDNILYNYRIRCEDRLLAFIEKTFGYSKVDIFPELENKITAFFAKFDSYTRFTDKMRFLYNNVNNVNNFTEEEFSSILGSIDIIFRNYFTVLGRDRIRALQFRKYALDAEYERLYGNQNKNSDLKSSIYSTFIIGNRYTKVYVKQKLGEIYNNLGIQSSPKATDIENYFEVKKVQITNKETGKKDHGYLILKIKE